MHGARIAGVVLVLLAGVVKASVTPAETAERATQTLENWFGPGPQTARLTLPESRSVLVDDPLLERHIVTAVAHSYWNASGDAAPPLAVALGSYSGNRLVHTQLAGRHFHVLHLFDGAVPFVIRRLPLSPAPSAPGPRIRNFDALAARRERVESMDDRTERLLLTLHTLERYLGWPVLQQVLAELKRRSDTAPLSEQLLLESLQAVTGRDFSWLVRESLAPDRSFDYAVTELRREPMDDGFRTTVVVARLGNAAFTGTSEEPVGAFESGRGIVVDIEFEDTVVREFWDGRAAQREFTYESRTPARAAYVDSDRVLVMDTNPFNNGIRTTPGPAAVPARWSLQWLAWLQDLLLAVPAL